MNRINIIAFALCLAGLLLAPSAFAACSNPTGEEGQQIYNVDHKVMQFCDGTDWISMAGGGSGGGGIDTDSPATCEASTEGRVRFNSTDDNLEVCINAGGPYAWADIVHNACVPTVKTNCQAHYDSGCRTNGTFSVDPDGAGGNPAFDVYCEMDSANGHGWTLVSKVGSSDNFHGSTGATTTSNLAGNGTGKLSDTDINALMQYEYRFKCGSEDYTYFPDTCVFSATGAASSNCSKMSNSPGGSYTQCTTWSTHYGLNTYNCTPYVIYKYGGGNGCNSSGSQPGSVWVR